MLLHNISNQLSQLRAFQSHDFVRSSFKVRHNREINAQRTKDICANFVQGLNYYESASSSDTSVKPLLLYYSVLAFSRGAILFCDPNKKEEGLKASHGLDA